MPSFFAALLILAAPAVAPVGDGSALGVLVGNPGVHPVTAQLGAAGRPGLSGQLAGYGELRARVQCTGGNADALPALSLEIDGRVSPIAGQPIAFPDGPPALWISDAHQGRAALAKLVAGVRPGLQVKHLEPKAVPTGFEALRFAPLIIVDGASAAALPEGARRALQGAVAAGSVVLFAMGAADAPGSALDGFLDAEPGETRSVGPALGAALPRATAARPLTPSGVASVRVSADQAPLVVAAPLGLGEVRAVGVVLSELAPGPVAQAAFGAGPDGFGQVLSWLDRAPPLGDGAGVRWSVWAWASLLVIPLLGLIYRRWPRLAVALAAPGWLAAVWAPPVDEALSVDAARVLVVPISPSEGLAIGTVDVTLGVGGGRTLQAGVPEVALEDARPQGACLVRMGEAAGFAVHGEPGGRRRLTWLARVPLPSGGTVEAHLPAWPPGPLAKAGLARLPVDAVPAGLSRGASERLGWLARLEPPVAVSPVVLEAPAEP